MSLWKLWDLWDLELGKRVAAFLVHAELERHNVSLY